MNGPSIDEVEVEDRLETRSVFERLVEDGRLRGDGIPVLRERLYQGTVFSEERLRFRRAIRTLERRGPHSAWARRQLRLIIGGRDDSEAA